MAEYADKIGDLLEKARKLQQKQERLTEKRKNEVADLAFRNGLLVLSDALLAGAFFEISQAAKHHPDKIKQWEAAGMQQFKFQKHKNKSDEPATKKPTFIMQAQQEN